MLRSIRAMGSLLLFRVGEQDRFDVAGTVQYAQNFHYVSGDAIEDQVVPVNDPPDSAIPAKGVPADMRGAFRVTWHNGLLARQ
jgi:hypothetical protein